jgi:hypothetical protein
MKSRTLFPIAVAVSLAAGSQRGLAQETPKPEAAKEVAAERRSVPGVSLRVQLVISRYQGEKKLASFPYMFVVATLGGLTRTRMGVDTPVPTTSASEGGKQTTSIQYRNVGTNIDCSAKDWGEGRFLLVIGVENSSALALEKGPSSGNPGAPVDASTTGIPLFRRFDSNLSVVLRDGQSVQTVASTDPVTGDVVKIDVTMNVIR